LQTIYSIVHNRFRKETFVHSFNSSQIYRSLKINWRSVDSELSGKERSNGKAC
jgi:hypothetical protein